MKIQRIIIGFTVLLMAIYAGAFIYINQTNVNTVDVTKINNVVKTIEKQLTDQNMAIERIGENDDMSYAVIFKADENYNAMVFDAIENRQTLVDLTSSSNNSDVETIVGKVIILNDGTEENTMKAHLLKFLSFIVLAVLILVYVTIGVVYVRILKPFDVMKQFAQKIADGDLEYKLPMDKGNYFGAFTESFDLMREELIKARQGEFEANISKKELVAELSHDIKTPVATIKAICELLQAKLGSVKTNKTTTENTAIIQSMEKIEVINTKADIIDKLISNMFHATLEELEMLKVTVSEQPSPIITRMFRDINHFEKIQFINDVPQCLIKCDPLRLSQVIDNVISNSYKYAGTFIDIAFSMNQVEKLLIIKIRDYGPGFETDEGPLLCEKFFRGSGENVNKTPGSGLGLYLASQFMEAMEGSIECFNENGFVAKLHIKMV